MNATEDCSKVTAIILIQPASYLQHGRAAYPANLSFVLGTSQGDFHFPLNYPMPFQFWAEAHHRSNICA